MKRFSSKERDHVLRVINSESHTSMVRQLEERFAERFDCKYAIGFVNGTATMHAALAAAGVGPGDEVIVPPLTFASTALAVVHANAMPVFADIDPDTWTISPASIEAQITERTRAIIPVSIYGLSPDMDPIMGIADRHSLFVLEDDAECFLGYYKGRLVGSIGDASSFSFETSKHMTSGQGGMITTNDPDLATAIRRFGALGYGSVRGKASEGAITKDVLQDPFYERHVSLGWNYLLSEICAAVALGQLERLDELVEMRIRVAAIYEQARNGCAWLIGQKVPTDSVHTYWTYVLRLERRGVTWQCFRREYIENGGDPMYAAWLPTYMEPVFRQKTFGGGQSQRFDLGLCPITEAIQPWLLQFKTDYVSVSDAERQADALARTIAHFD